METVYVWEPITTDKVAIRLLTTTRWTPAALPSDPLDASPSPMVIAATNPNREPSVKIVARTYVYHSMSAKPESWSMTAH